MSTHPGLNSVAVHAGREEFGALGVHAPPLDLSSTYPMTDIERDGADYEFLAKGGSVADNPIYSRVYNPTTARMESAIASLEGCTAAVAFSSGMAALTACLVATCRERRHVVGVRNLYGGTDVLLSSQMLGIEATMVTPSDIAGALRPETGLVVVETPQNPTLDTVDIAAVVEAAQGVPVLVDNTFATPVMQNPLEHGATYSLHSATKFLSGHGDVLAGVVAMDEAAAPPVRQCRILTGAVLSPFASYLVHRGLPTLPLRVERGQRTAAALVERLQGCEGVRRVCYPGLDGPLPPQLRGPGCMFAFDLIGGFAAAQRFVKSLTMITHATSLGTVDTLVQHCAGISHRFVDEDDRAATGISPGLLRVSVGLEDVDDLWTDLERGLTAANHCATRDGVVTST